MISSSSAEAGYEPSRLAGGWRRSSRRWGCSCAPPRRGSFASPRGRGLRSLGFPPAQGGVLALAGPLVPAAVALVTGDAVRAGQDPISHGSEARWLADRGDRGQAQPQPAGLGRLLPPRQLRAEVRRDRPLRPRAFGDLGQCEARAPGTELATPPHGGVAGPPRRLSPQREGALRDCACLAVNDVGKPGAGEPHARFDRGPLAKQQPRRAGTDAPTGKPAELSPAAYRSLTSQRPTLPPGLTSPPLSPH